MLATLGLFTISPAELDSVSHALDRCRAASGCEDLVRDALAAWADVLACLQAAEAARPAPVGVDLDAALANMHVALANLCEHDDAHDAAMDALGTAVEAHFRLARLTYGDPHNNDADLASKLGVQGSY